MSTRLTYHGAASFEIVGPTHRVLIDPFLSQNPMAPCAPDDLETPDVILVSHAAFDHYGDSASIAKRTGAPVVCDAAVRAMLIDDGVSPDQVSATTWGIVVEAAGLKIRPVECHHWSSGTLSDGRQVVGNPIAFIVETEPGVRIYHYGDTCIFDMRLIGELYRPTVGLLGCTLPRELSHLIPGPATFLTGEMDADEAARTAEMLGLELAVACHYLAKDAEVDRFLELVPNYDTTGRREAVAPDVGRDARRRRVGLDARRGVRAREAMAAEPKKLTIFDVQAKVAAGEKVFQVTATDFPTALLVDRAGIDFILIGDSLGMTALGYPSTVPVTMDEMIHHAKAISRAAKRSILVGDLPLGAYHASTADAVTSAMRMVKEGGADVVKMEGGEDVVPMIEAVVRAGIPVMGHMGLTPQLISKLGGWRVQGKSGAAGAQLVRDADALERAGCFAVVLEAIPDRVATLITERLEIPTIGIGAGPGCDGQNLVLHDLVGLFDRFLPRFAKRYVNVGETIDGALREFQQEVHDGVFPSAEHSFAMDDAEYEALLTEIGNDA